MLHMLGPTTLITNHSWPWEHAGEVDVISSDGWTGWVMVDRARPLNAHDG